jgi:hypothetical protein
VAKKAPPMKAESEQDSAAADEHEKPAKKTSSH